MKVTSCFEVRPRIVDVHLGELIDVLMLTRTRKEVKGSQGFIWRKREEGSVHISKKGEDL